MLLFQRLLADEIPLSFTFYVIPLPRFFQNCTDLVIIIIIRLLVIPVRVKQRRFARPPCKFVLFVQVIGTNPESFINKTILAFNENSRI